MVNSTEQFTRRVFEQARLRGQLVDLSDQAARVGLDCRCEISEHLYHSLFWKYPSAGEHDIIAASDLLRVLRNRQQNPELVGKHYYYSCPQQPIWWLRTGYFFKLMVTYCEGRLESVVIMSQKDSLESLLSRLPQAVPATLLLRLRQSIRRLGTLSYRSELPLLRTLDTTTTELMLRSPFHEEISLYLSQQQPNLLPYEFSRQQYREVTLRSLLGQLELTAAVAEKMGAVMSLPVSAVLQLMANYVGYVPPTEDYALPGDKVPFH